MRSKLRNAVDRHYADLYRFAYRMTGSRERAEDAAQEAFLRFARDGAWWDGADESARRWLFVVTRNLCIGQLRRDARENSVPLDKTAELPAPGPGPSEMGEAAERREWVAQAVQELPAAMREVVILREYERLSYIEIASITGCAVGTVKSRLARARETLRGRLAKHLEGYA